MPKIQGKNLPPPLPQHLFDRLEQRKITAEDLYKLKLWRDSEPDAPDGPWYKDFGSFKICGEGRFPRTFLLRAKPQKARLSNSRVLFFAEEGLEVGKHFGAGPILRADDFAVYA